MTLPTLEATGLLKTLALYAELSGVQLGYLGKVIRIEPNYKIGSQKPNRFLHRLTLGLRLSHPFRLTPQTYF